MEKNILLHMCCGPCTEYPLLALREENYQITGYFYNPNIQPQAEHDRRKEGVEQLAQIENFPVYYDETCLEEVWRNFQSPCKTDHCNFCYNIRMQQTAKFAKEHGFTAFTTTLLVSPWQDQEKLRLSGELAAGKYGLDFLYRDFRPGYAQGQMLAKTHGIYRQKYCGCIYSLGESNYKEKIAKQLDLPLDSIPTRQL